MANRKLIRSDRFPYHVGARSNNREHFPLALSQLWRILTEECWAIQTLYDVEIHALVLMPNHFHLLLTTPSEDLGVVMQYFLNVVTKRTNAFSGRSGRIFGGPYFRSVVQGTRYFGHALKYILRNPVKAGLCEQVEDWKFSTLHGTLGSGHLPFPIHFTRLGMEVGLPLDDSDRLLEWLNKPFPKEAELLIQKGLRKKLFSQVKDRSNRCTPVVLHDLL